MQQILLKIKELFLKIYNNQYVRAFVLIYLFGLVAFGITAARNDFTIPMGGDYVLQSYAFYSQGYTVFWDFIKTGEYPLFDFSNYLGANYLGTQSFYYVYSPLFYLLCLWPKKFLYQGIFFHMVFKFALGGFFMYILLKKYFSVSEKMSILGGLIYAFSGFTLFYVWFHFGDIIAFFPLFIMGVEKVLKERKGWLLALGLFLCGLANYFFLVNFIIFGIFYALYRWIHVYGINKKRGFDAKTRYSVLFQGIIYAVVGAMMSAICLLPSLHVALETSRTTTSAGYVLDLLKIFFVNPERVDGELILGEVKVFKEIVNAENLKELFNVLFVWGDRHVGSLDVSGDINIGYILSNWLFMNTNCWDDIIFYNGSTLDNSLGGFFITTPLTMLLIPSIVAAIKTKRPWTIFGVVMCLIIPFIPITGHMAFAFTSLYGRWQIWLVMIGIIFIIPTLDKFELVDRRWVTVNLIFNYVLALFVYLISKKADRIPTNILVDLFGMKVPANVIIVIIELVVMLIVWFVYRFKLFKPAIIKRVMIFIVVVEIGASTVITTEQKGYFDWDEYYLSQPQYEELNEVIEDLKEEDTSFYRIMNTEATRSIMNLPSSLNYKGASSFNSTYAFALDTFKNRSKMAYSGGWTMGNHEKRYWLDQYLGTKYYIIDKKDINNDNADYYKDDSLFFDGRTSVDEAQQEYRLNLPWSYKLHKSYEYYDVYINTNFTDIGYSLDQYIASSKVGTSKKATYYEELYADTVVIEDLDLEYVQEELGLDNCITTHFTNYKNYNYLNWDLYFSPREDICIKTGDQVDVKRPVYKIEGKYFSKEEVSQYMKSTSQFFHTRWEEKQYFGDQFILQVKEGLEPLCKEATKDKLAYLNIDFKLGPKVKISLYNNNVLVTEDAHMNSNSSLHAYGSEWKLQRGFYVDQPINKIVIECVSDTSYEKMFRSGNSLPSIEINYMYQDVIESMQEKVNNKVIEDVTYHNNKFTFKTNLDSKEIVVTNIPYDEGWTLKSDGKERKIIVVNGGFVGFIANEGEENYELSYFTPNLKEGLFISLTGLLLFIALAFVYKNKKSSILILQQQLADNYFKKQEEQEKIELAEFESKKENFLNKLKRK